MKLESKSWLGVRPFRVEHRRRRETKREEEPPRRPTFAYIGGEVIWKKSGLNFFLDKSNYCASIVVRATVQETCTRIEFSSAYVVKLVVWTKCARRTSFRWQRERKGRGRGRLLMEIFDAFAWRISRSFSSIFLRAFVVPLISSL